MCNNCLWFIENFDFTKLSLKHSNLKKGRFYFALDVQFLEERLVLLPYKSELMSNLSVFVCE